MITDYLVYSAMVEAWHAATPGSNTLSLYSRQVNTLACWQHLQDILARRVFLDKGVGHRQ